MPIKRGAIKKLRQDEKREYINMRIKKAVKLAVKKYKNNPNEKLLTELFKNLDRACKKNIMHKNKSSRIKSRMSKLLGKNKTKKLTPAKKETKAKKSTVRKTTTKTK